MGQLTEGVLRNNGISKKGGGASFPIIVDGSGTSLPTAQSEGETFLNTTDKKLYTAQVGGYALNTYTSIGENVSFNPTTSVVSGMGTSLNYQVKRTSGAIAWEGSGVKIRVHFKLNSLPASNSNYTLFTNAQSTYGSPGKIWITQLIISNRDITLNLGTSQYGPTTVSNTTILTNPSWETNKDYYLEVTKDGTNGTVTLATDGYGEGIVESNTFETQDNHITSGTYSGSTVLIGASSYNFNFNSFTIGEIYLVDTTGDLVVPDTSSLFWDSGENLKDKNEYADKTNSILYLYENNELVNIGGGCSSITKQVYSISANNTTTLDVSADFTTIVDVLKNGVELVETDDYTVSNGVITFVTALSTTDKIIVKGE